MYDAVTSQTAESKGRDCPISCNRSSFGLLSAFTRTGDISRRHSSSQTELYGTRGSTIPRLWAELG